MSSKKADIADLKQIALSELHFDPENPRLPTHLCHADDDGVLNYLLLETDLIELMLSIAEQGFFIGEPLLVTKNKNGTGYIVVEGNRRLAALKLLSGQSEPPIKKSQVNMVIASAKQRPPKAYCLEFKERSNILSYLGFRHITGIKEWGPIAKARYLQQLRERHPELTDSDAHKVLAKEIGSKSNHVAKLLTGLSLVEFATDNGTLQELGLEEDQIPFSILTTAIASGGICEYIGISGPTDVGLNSINESALRDLFRWLFYKEKGGQTVLGESRNLVKLNRVLAHSVACEKLRNGVPLDEADLYTTGPLETFRAFMLEVSEKIKRAQESINTAEGLNESDLDLAEKIRKQAASLYGSTKELVRPDEW